MLFRPTKSVAILGGGIAGLTAAWRLAGMGHRIRLFEETGRLGGAVRTETTDGWLVEAGPQSFREETIPLTLMLNELKLDRDRIEANPAAAKRYLVRDGRLVATPRSPSGFLASPLLPVGAKLRAAGDLFRRPATDMTDLSFADFMRRHFGRQVLEQIAQPIVNGIYAGDPEKLSTRYAFSKLWDLNQRYGSLVRGQAAYLRADEVRGEIARPKTISFRRGLQTLYHALVLQMPAGSLAINARVEVVRPGPPHWSVFWRELRNPTGSPTAEGEAAAELQGEPFDLVVSTLPAQALARLQFAPGRECPLARLAEIEHPPLSTLFLGFRRDQVTHPLDGFGVLVPAREKRSILGVVFSSSVFGGRAPEGHVGLTVMVGGSLQPDLARRSTRELLATVRPDLEALLGVRGEPVFVRHHFWPRSIPQYNLGHGKMLEAIGACERANPGLYIAGQVCDGVSLSQAIRAGERLALRIALMGTRGMS